MRRASEEALCSRSQRGWRSTRGGRLAEVAERQLDAVVAALHQGDGILQPIPRRRGDAQLLPLDLDLDLLQARVADILRYLLGGFLIDPLLERDDLARTPERAVLDLALVEVLERHAPATQLLAQDAHHGLQPVLVVRVELERAGLPVELDGAARALEVVARGDLLGRLV